MDNQQMIITLKEYRDLMEICRKYLQLLKDHDIIYTEYMSLLEEKQEASEYKIGFRCEDERKR